MDSETWLHDEVDEFEGRMSDRCRRIAGPDATPWPLRLAFAAGILVALVFVLWFLVALWRAHAGR